MRETHRTRNPIAGSVWKLKVGICEHEAAHAIVALQPGLKVTDIALIEEGPLRGGIVCDWEASRGTVPDAHLITSSFALAYAGVITGRCATSYE